MSSSPSAEPSPSSSTRSFRGNLTLEELVRHFVASKRSLTATSQVWRANEIVTLAREALQDNAALSAKNSFFRQAIEGQVHVLDAVKHGADQLTAQKREEFTITLKTLDAAGARLDSTLSVLRSTSVEPSFQPGDSPTKLLYDFVDENGVSDLTSAIHSSIDRTKAAISALNDATDYFEASIQSINPNGGQTQPEEHSTRSGMSSTSGSFKIQKIDDGVDDPSPVPSLFRGLESHATEMATLLQSLVGHYDLCITALKHTEGGGEAAQEAAGEMGATSQGELAVGLGVDIPELQQDSAAQQPISEEDRLNMYAVLANDAHQVEDAVLEIRNRLAEMEAQLEDISMYVASLRSTNQDLLESIRRLRRVGSQIPGFLSAVAEFLAKWEDEKRKVSEKLDELDDLRGFYEGFEAAYDGLIVEAARRRNVKGRMQKIVREAMDKVQKLYNEDQEQRADFKADQGEFLPSDIWPGLTDAPIRYEIREAEGQSSDVPDISKSTLEKAVRRLQERG